MAQLFASSAFNLNNISFGMKENVEFINDDVTTTSKRDLYALIYDLYQLLPSNLDMQGYFTITDQVHYNFLISAYASGDLLFSDGSLTAGQINSIGIGFDGDFDWFLTGLSLSAPEIDIAVSTFGAIDDVQLFKTLLGGNDEAYLSIFADAFSGGTGNDIIYGFSGNDTLSGDAGNDTLLGGFGNDRLVGGFGNDIFITEGGDTIIESANQGTDSVQSSAAYTLGTNLENLTLSGSAAINGTGNSLSNIIYGNNANNILNGSAGSDTLVGGWGADKLIGGTGRDRLTGGSGNDAFIFKLVAESGSSATTADVITDFVKGQDKINLSSIDAFAASSVNDAFIWNGSFALYNSTKGEVRFQKFDNAGTTNDYTMVWIDNDADTTAEMTIRLTGLHNLTGSDFLL